MDQQTRLPLRSGPALAVDPTLERADLQALVDHTAHDCFGYSDRAQGASRALRQIRDVLASEATSVVISRGQSGA